MADEENKDVNPDQTEDQVQDTPENENETPEENTEEPVGEPKEEDKEPESTDEPEEEPSEDEPEEEAEEEESDSDYNSYEHPALKQAVTILTEAELPVEEANAIFAEAVETGDMSKIKKDVLIEKIGKEKADVVLVLAESYYNTAFSGMKALKEEAFSITGGEENFNAMREYAKERAAKDPEFAKDLAEFRAMLDSGQPRAIKAAIKELNDIYRQDPDTTIEADLEVGDKSASSAGVEPLSRKDYIDAVEKAHRDGTYEKVSKSLWARRNAGIKKGI